MIEPSKELDEILFNLYPTHSIPEDWISPQVRVDRRKIAKKAILNWHNSQLPLLIKKIEGEVIGSVKAGNYYNKDDVAHALTEQRQALNKLLKELTE